MADRDDPATRDSAEAKKDPTAAARDYRRLVVGLGSAGCLIAAPLMIAYAPDRPMMWGGTLRAGVLLGVLWLALPSRKTPAAWADLKPFPLIVGLLTLWLVARFPKVGVPLAVLLAIASYVGSGRRRAKGRAGRGRPSR